MKSLEKFVEESLVEILRCSSYFYYILIPDICELIRGGMYRNVWNNL